MNVYILKHDWKPEFETFERVNENYEPIPIDDKIGKERILPNWTMEKYKRQTEIQEKISLEYNGIEYQKNYISQQSSGKIKLDLIYIPEFLRIKFFSLRSLILLEDLIREEAVELLPICCEERMFFGANILKKVDIIDFVNSEKKFYKKYVTGLKKIKIKNIETPMPDIFMAEEVEGYQSYETFVTDEFKKKVEENSFLGFKFEKVGEII